MVIYNVIWTVSPELSKGKGRVSSKDYIVGFNVLCRNSQDAVKCLHYHFRCVYKNPNGLTLEDGIITLSRTKVDSRNFTANYLMMDVIKEPLSLSDLKNDNLLRLNKIF